MGFIAQFDSDWAGEMDVFGLKYFGSMDEYLKEFCWETAFSCIDVYPQDMAEFLGIPKEEDKLYYNYEKEMVDYFTKHPGEMKTKYYELDGDDEQEEDFGFNKVDHVYINFIYAALVMRMEDNPNFSIYDDRGVSICVGTNQEIYMSISDYLGYLMPDIFVEGDIAEKITHENSHYQKGPFYF